MLPTQSDRRPGTPFRRPLGIHWCHLLTFLLLCLPPPATVTAATLQVTTLADSGPGSLRQAIADAAGGDAVQVLVSGLIFFKSTVGPESSELTISKDLTIQGTGSDRLFLGYDRKIRPDFLGISNATVTLSDLCFSNCYVAWTAGGGALNLSNCVALKDNSFRNYSGCSMTLENCHLEGGDFAIISGGFLRVVGTTFYHNTTAARLAYPPGGTNEFVNTTFTGNERAIAMTGGGLLSLTNCTIAANHMGLSSASRVRVFNSIIANNKNAGVPFDCSGYIDSLDYNLIGSTDRCTITNLVEHNIYGLDPGLAPLGQFGGLTRTMPPLAGSPVIDSGASSGVPETDQRGRVRPFGSTSDIGAVESSPPYALAGNLFGFTLHGDVDISVNQTNTATALSGNLRVFGMAPGEYTITPLGSDYLFIPSNRTVSIPPDYVGADFRVYRWNSLSLDGLTNNVLHLAFPGSNGQTFELLGSSNLVEWKVLSTNTVPESALLKFTPPFSGGFYFYRTVQR